MALVIICTAVPKGLSGKRRMKAYLSGSSNIESGPDISAAASRSISDRLEECVMIK